MDILKETLKCYLFMAFFNVCLLGYTLMLHFVPAGGITRWLYFFESRSLNFIFLISLFMSIAFALTKVSNYGYNLIKNRLSPGNKIRSGFKTLD